MNRTIRHLVAVFLVTALSMIAVSGCGDEELPADAVASVSGTSIGHAEFERWFKLNGGRAAGADTRRKTMELLIIERWLLDEARRRDIEVTAESVMRPMRKQAERDLGKPLTQAQYSRLLNGAGATANVLIRRSRLDVLRTKVLAVSPSDGAVDDYYRAHESFFVQPASRDAQVLLTETQARALRAKHAFGAGVGWRAIVQRYGLRTRSAPASGQAVVIDGDGDESLNVAVRKAPVGVTVGPVESPLGWWVFRVRRVDRASKMPSREATALAQSLVRSRAMEMRLYRIIESYRPQTRCAEDFRVAQCANRPGTSSE